MGMPSSGVGARLFVLLLGIATLWSRVEWRRYSDKLGMLAGLGSFICKF